MTQAEVPSVEPLAGPGRFQWSTSGWFGALFGGTSWMLLCPALLVSRAPIVAWIWALCGLTSIAVGVWLWSRRARILPYPAIMGMLLTQWICACVAVVSLVVLAPRSMEPFEANTPMMFACLLTFPALMILFTIMERNASA